MPGCGLQELGHERDDVWLADRLARGDRQGVVAVRERTDLVGGTNSSRGNAAITSSTRVVENAATAKLALDHLRPQPLRLYRVHGGDDTPNRRRRRSGPWLRRGSVSRRVRSIPRPLAFGLGARSGSTGKERSSPSESRSGSPWGRA